MLIKYIQTHPIPYQSPFIRYLTKNKIKIKVLYRSNISTTKFYDQDFQKEIKWDTELLKNIDYKYLNYIGPNKVTSIFPITTNFIEKIFDNNFLYKKKKIQKNKKLTYLFAAKFRKRKGPDLLLRSINLLKKNKTFTSNVKFVFVGEGYMKKELKEYTKQKDLKNVSFLPFQNQKRLKKIYQKSDIFVMPSREEPWGLALNEAMASENVIISSNLVGSSFDLVKNGMNGYKFKNGDYKDLANKMLKVYHQKKRLTQFKLNSKRIISKWDFKMCLTGIKKAIRTITI
jgi:glycosyltransferase involved in cell wall biosynthesis